MASKIHYYTLQHHLSHTWYIKFGVDLCNTRKVYRITLWIDISLSVHPPMWLLCILAPLFCTKQVGQRIYIVPRRNSNRLTMSVFPSPSCVQPKRRNFWYISMKFGPLKCFGPRTNAMKNYSDRTTFSTTSHITYMGYIKFVQLYAAYRMISDKSIFHHTDGSRSPCLPVCQSCFLAVISS